MQVDEAEKPDTIVAPSQQPREDVLPAFVNAGVEVLATVIGRKNVSAELADEAKAHGGDIVAVRQGNVLGTSFHPELTNDARIHVWWLESVRDAALKGGMS